MLLQGMHTDEQRLCCYTEMVETKRRTTGTAGAVQLRATAAQTLTAVLHIHGGLSVTTDLRQVTDVHFHVAAFTRPVQPLHVNIQGPAR